MGIYTKGMFTAAELEEIREKFYYVDKDCYGGEKIYGKLSLIQRPARSIPATPLRRSRWKSYA